MFIFSIMHKEHFKARRRKFQQSNSNLRHIHGCSIYEVKRKWKEEVRKGQKGEGTQELKHLERQRK